MGQLVLMVFGPALLGLVGALAAWAVWWRRAPRPAVRGAVRGWTLAGVLLASGVVLAQLLLGTPLVGIPRWSPTGLRMAIYVVPLIAGVLAVALLALPVARQNRTGTAELQPRTLLTFASRWWFLALGGLVALVVLVAVWAGRVSVPDDQGRYTMYWIELGSSSMGTTMYGWYFSRPALAVTAVLVLAALLVLRSLARPALASDRDADGAVRRWRTRNVMAMTTGALLLHLARVVGSLAGTAGMHGGTSTDQGWFSAWTPFAALEGPLRIAADVLEAGAWFLWFSVLLLAVTRSVRNGAPAQRRAVASP